MASGLYNKTRKLFCDADLDLLVDDIKVVLVDVASYTVDLDADDFLADITGAMRIAISGNLASKTTTGGIFDADDLTFLAVSGAELEAVVVYKDTGAEATSPLIAYLDDLTGLPITPNGTDINLVWNASGIFKL